jgi:hypothetical protein
LRLPRSRAIENGTREPLETIAPTVSTRTGVPPRVVVSGRVVFLCCEGCENHYRDHSHDEPPL